MNDSGTNRPLPAQFDLTGRVALVTGGTGYLGRALSSALAEAGATVVVGSRDRAEAQAAAKQLPHGQHAGVALDYSSDESIADGFRATLEVAGAVDILVNNGHIPCPQDLTNIDSEGFASQMRNAAAYFLLARMVRDAAVERSAAASIIMLGSMYGSVGSYPEAYAGICPASSVAYQCLKGGVAQMTRHLAVYWARDRVRVNTLSPGPFPDPSRVPAELIERLSAKSPLGRMGEPSELKGAVVFLASDASSYVTGHNLIVDGGWTAW